MLNDRPARPSPKKVTLSTGHQMASHFTKTLQNITPENGVSQQEKRKLHPLNIDWNGDQSNQLIDRKRHEGYVNPRGFEATRVSNLSWKSWRRRQNHTEGVDEQVDEFSSQETPTFELLASAKPLCNVRKIISQEMNKTSYLSNTRLKTSYFSNTRPRALKHKVRTSSISQTKDVKCESKESTYSDAPRKELKSTVAKLDKTPNKASSKGNINISRAGQFSPARTLKWLEENYRAQDDLLTRIDKSKQGGLSYDEFVQELVDMGAPGSQDELNNMAFALDTSEDQSIDYQEVKKLRRRFMASSFVNNNEFMHYRNESLPELRPCSKCKIGLFEPIRTRIHRFISLVLKNFIIKGTQKNSLIGQFRFNVGPDISIYGIQQMVKAELGGLAIGVRILRGNRKVEVLEHMKTLEDYGYRGSTVRDRPEVVELFYDYDFPKLDCPLLLAPTSK